MTFDFPCLLRSHVWLYPRINVSKSHGNTSMYVDTVIKFAKYHILRTTYYVQNEWSHSLFLNTVQARQKVTGHFVEFSNTAPCTKETNMAMASKMTCKIGLIWRHIKPSIALQFLAFKSLLGHGFPCRKRNDYGILTCSMVLMYLSLASATAARLLASAVAYK